MAREEQDREDLLGEAKALVERVELRLPGEEGPVVVGFRKCGATSFYFGADPVYQFNTARELRRAFRDGRLIKAAEGKLVSMERVRLAGAVVLQSHELDRSEMQKLLRQVRRRLISLRDALQAGEYQIVGQVPADACVVLRTLGWLGELPDAMTAAQRPNVE